jgi:hypothetical protein
LLGFARIQQCGALGDTTGREGAVSDKQGGLDPRLARSSPSSGLAFDDNVFLCDAASLKRTPELA